MWASAVVAALALALACPAASAQLPELSGGTLVEDTVEQTADTVDEAVDAPLPQPVEEVVSESPVAPVREEVRRVAGEVTDGVGGGGGGGGSGGASGAGPPQAAVTPGSGSGESAGGAPGGAEPRSDGPRRAARRGAGGRGGDGAGGDATRGAPAGLTALAGDGLLENAAARPDATADEGGNPLIRAIDRVVEVVPTLVWVALGVLALVALALGARTFVERRRARLLEADREQLLHELGMLERALLPEVPPELGGVAASVAYRPSDGPAAGGDFYDVFELPRGRVAVLVGDVSGHGPEALERTNVIRSGLHACLEAGMSPRDALASVGERSGLDSDGRFVTVVVAVHDPWSGTLTYATAGHPPPIVAGVTCHEPLTAVSSPPIGVGFRTGLRQTTLPVDAGAVVCLFTDGLIEARAGDGMLGREGLAAIVDELGPEERADALLERVRAAADETADDMAVCLVRPLAGAEPPAPCVETLELDAEDTEHGVAERFMEACAVPSGDAAIALDEVRALTAAGGGAVIEVTVAREGVRASVLPAGPRLERAPA